MNHPEYELTALEYTHTKALPVLWSIGAKAFAAELGKLAAGKLLSAVLSEPTISRAEVERLLEMAVAEIKRHITDSLTQQTILEVNGHIDGCLDLLKQFSLSPQDDSRLDMADAQISLAIGKLGRIGHQALTVYVYALHVKLLCVAIKFKHRNHLGEILVFESQLEAGAQFIEDWIKQIKDSLNQRINSVGSISVKNYPKLLRTDPIGGETYIDNWMASFNDNGKIIHSEGHLKKKDARKEAETKRAKAILFYQTAVNDFTTSVVYPTAETIAVLYATLDSLQGADADPN